MSERESTVESLGLLELKIPPRKNLVNLKTFHADVLPQHLKSVKLPIITLVIKISYINEAAIQKRKSLRGTNY